MIPHCPSKRSGYELLVDGVSVKFSYYAPNDIKVSTHMYL